MRELCHKDAKMALRQIIAAGAVVGLAGASAGTVHAAESIVLKFANPGPMTTSAITVGAQPWAAKIKDATDGLVDIQILTGIASYANIYDRILNDVADFGFGTFGAVEDQFPGSSVTALPFVTQNSIESGVGLWRLYNNGMLAEEYRRVKPIAMFGFGTSALFLSKPIAKLEDLKGMKVFANGRMNGKIVSQLDMVPISSNPGALYQGLSRNLASGAVFSWSGVEQIGLTDVVRGAVDLPFGRAGGWFFMNKEAFAKLPEKAQAAIDKFSGEEIIRPVAGAWDNLDSGVEARLAADPAKFQNRKLSKAEMDRIRQVLQPITDEWVATTPNGAKILAAFNEEVARLPRP
jgi:TRAP-type C4-dicarboxylate transport system substrate-binding protein